MDNAPARPRRWQLRSEISEPTQTQIRCQDLNCVRIQIRRKNQSFFLVADRLQTCPLSMALQYLKGGSQFNSLRKIQRLPVKLLIRE